MNLPVVEPPFGRARPVGSVGGVVLAAGRSSRFGADDKLLAMLDGDPLVRHAAAPVAATTAETIVVTRPERTVELARALDGLDVGLASNPEADAGRGTSVRRGLAGLGDHAAVVVTLGDLPLVDARTVELLVEAFAAGAGTALAAGHEGQRGNPVLFGARHFDALRSLAPDEGGRAVLAAADDAAVVETGDPGVRQDVDTPAALANLRDGTE